VLRAEQKYREENLAVLFVGHQDVPRKLTIYARKNNIPEYLFDRDDRMSRAYRITYGAGVVFIDRQGIVRLRIPKAFSPAVLEAGLQKILRSDPTVTAPMKPQ